MSNFKKVISVLMIVVMFFCVIPRNLVFAESNVPQKPKVTVSVEAYNETLITPTRVDMTLFSLSNALGENISEPAFYSPLHAVVAGLQAQGIDCKNKDQFDSNGGTYVSKVSGLTSGSVNKDYRDYWMYVVNHQLPSVGMNEMELHDGDNVELLFVTDYLYGYYAWFDQEKMEAPIGKSITLNLKGISLMSYPAVTEDINDATITINGKETNYKTDANGQVTVIFDKAGEYLLSAVKPIGGEVGDLNALSHSHCKIVVKEDIEENSALIKEFKITPTNTSIGLNNREGVWNPTLSATAQEREFSTSVNYLVDAITVTPSLVSSGTKIKVNNNLTAQSIPLEVGKNEITVETESQNGQATEKYTFFITRDSESIVKPLPEKDLEAAEINKMLDTSKNYYENIQNKKLSSWWNIGAFVGAWGSPKGYILPDYSNEFKSSAPSDYAGRILGVIATNGNPYHTFSGQNLVDELVKMQKENGKFSDIANQNIWAVITLNSANAEKYCNTESIKKYNQEAAVTWIMDMQGKDGGIGGVDITAMALIALSGAREIAGVDTSIEKGVSYLKANQNKVGTYIGGWGENNSNTLATVISGLVSAGENISSEKWMVEGISPIKVLYHFQLENGGFEYSIGMGQNSIATYQSIIALGDVASGDSVWKRITYSNENDVADEVTKQQLTEQIEESSKIDFLKYTVESYGILKEAMEYGNKIKAQLSPSQEQIKMALSKIYAAMANLVARNESTGGTTPVIDNNKIVVSVSIRGDKKMGTVFNGTFTNLEKGATVFDLLKMICDTKGYSLGYSGTGDATYINQINGLSEFDNGPQSGWMLKVNDKYIDYSCAAYYLKNGDSVSWTYTDDYTIGKDYWDPKNALDVKINGINLLNADHNDKPVTSLSDLHKSVKDIVEKNYKKNVNSNWEEICSILDGNMISEAKLNELKDIIKKDKGQLRLTTDLAKIVLLLQIAGIDETKFENYNLLENIYNNENMGRQGTNGYIFSLIAMTNGTIPTNAMKSIDTIISDIINVQNQDGGFPLSQGSSSNVDITIMALQGLSAYKNQEKVKSSMEKALHYIEENQCDDGNFDYGTYKSSETLSQLIIALTCLGVNPDSKNFVKEHKTLMQLLLTYQNADGRFSHVNGMEANDMATEQAVLAMEAYINFFEGKNSIYTRAGEQVKKEVKQETVEERIKLPKDFDDASSWSKSFIEKGYKLGIIKGDSNGNFNPKRDITRAEFVTMLLNTLNISVEDTQDQENGVFSDVEKGSWYVRYVEKAGKLGLVKGFNGKFFPKDTISRQDMAVIIAKSYGLVGGEFSVADEEDISEYAKTSVSIVMEKDIMSGVGSGKFLPKGKTTREMAVKVLVNLIEKIANKGI